MQAYDNPRFVEDLVREVAGLLEADLRISWFLVAAQPIRIPGRP